MKILSPKIQNYTTQTGVGDDYMVMWKYDAGDHFQTAYKIDVYRHENLVYSTPKVRSSEQNNIKVHLELQEQTEYSFIVFSWDEHSREVHSDKAYFLSGVKKWRGEWIGIGTAKPFMARNEFTCRKKESSVLSICVPGQFQVLINGKKISPYVYEGSQTDFHKHVHYHTYDVTPFINEGKNDITVEVANGWYIGDDDNGRRYFYTMDKGYQPFGNKLVFIAQLKIGSEYIVTDDSWKVACSDTVLANIYGSEDIDKTVVQKWSSAKILNKDAPQGQLVPCNYPPVIRKYCYEPQYVDKERMIFDFGQNMSSQFYIKLKGRNGQKVRIIPAEKLAESGDIIQTVNTYSVLTLSGEEDVFEQKFSVNGARWYKIEGADYEQIKEFKSYFVTSSAEDCGYFKCSDEGINKIYNLILSAIESNLNHLHTDCPTIEKLGWLEPNHLMARSIMYNKNVDTLWSKISMDMRDSQYKEGEMDIDRGYIAHEYKEGLVPSIAPRYAKFITDWQEGSFWDIVPWGSSIILAAYEQYMFYGNKHVLKNNYANAKEYIRYLTAQYQVYNSLYCQSSSVCFLRTGLGDWGYRQNKGRSRENVETAIYYLDLMVMAEISAILGKGDKKFFRLQAESVKKEYNQALLVIEDDKAYYRDYEDGSITQTNQAIPLSVGLVPEKQFQKVQNTLIQLCEGAHLDCGEIGLVYIFRALAAANRNDIIYNLVMQDVHPSYLRFVEMGETTLPEFWSDDARSRNHDMMGHIMEWFFVELAGIKSTDGFRTVVVEPRGGDMLDWFECIFDSIQGKIEVKYSDGRISIAIPNNVVRINKEN